MKSQQITAIVMLLTLVIAVPTMIISASAQFSSPPSSQQQGTAVDSTRIFENEEFGFRLHIPQGWVAQDNTEEEGYFETLEFTGNAITTTLCKENEALLGIGGTYNCLDAQTTVGAEVTIYPDLQERPEFEAFEEENKTITTSDLVVLYTNYLQQLQGAYDFIIENNTDMDESTKIIHARYIVIDQAGTPLQPFDDFAIPWTISGMFVLSEDRNTGYSIVGPPTYRSTTGIPTENAAAMQEMFDSFELIEEE